MTRTPLFLLASLSLAFGAAGCDRVKALLPHAETASAPAAPAAPTTPVATASASTGTTNGLILSDPPGFEIAGKGDGVTPAPIYITVSLNINDFLRPELEDKSVHHFLDTTKKLGIDPVEVSFTGEVLDALLRTDPGLAAEVMQRKPTVNEHYRLLEFRRLIYTERELFWTDPLSLALDHARPGSLVAIQKAFGVTPRDNGGVIADLLRQKWKQGTTTAALAALGVQKVNKNDLILHPDRLVAASLDASRPDGHEHVEAYLTVFRMMDRVQKGDLVQGNELVQRLGDMKRWAHVAKLMGLDVTKVPGLADFVDSSRLGGFMLAPAEIDATDAEKTAVQTRAATDPAGVTKEMNDVFRRLCDATCAWHDPAKEVADRLAALDPNTAWAGRLSWHASNMYTVESWSKHLTGHGGRGPDTLEAAATRPEDEQLRIAMAYDAILTALKANPRVRFVSVDNDTQWLPENSPEKGYPDVFGVSFASVPGSLDPAKVDAQALAAGFQPPTQESNDRSKRPPGAGMGGQGAGGPGGGRGPRPEGGGQRGGQQMHGARDGGAAQGGRRKDGPHLAPRQPQ